MNIEEEENTGASLVADEGMIAMLNKSEIDQQIATAKQYPRSVVRFRKEAVAMVTLNERVAESCIYALPRDDKTIEGASARFAEIVASAWGNCRAGARVVSEKGDFVTAQGVFHDLERNVAITYEVQRRIVDKYGRRYKPDMIGVTANAACSIALRNAILKGIPKAFWDDMYEAARSTAMGDYKTLANRRAEAIKMFQSYGVSAEKICATLGVPGVEDIGLDQLVTLRGMLTAIRDGDTTPEQVFATEGNGKPAVREPQAKSEQQPTPENAPQKPQKPPVSPPPQEKAVEDAPANPAPAAEQAPQRAKAPAKSNGSAGRDTKATDGEKQFLLSRIKQSGASVEDVLQECGISNFDALTADGVIAIREHLAARAGG